MTRPPDPPIWATDTNYPAGGETWSATPTKVAPTGGMRQTGHIPEQAPSAQIENYDRNLEGLWFQYLQDIQPLNWPLNVSIGSVVANGNEAKALAHTTAPTIVLIGGVPAGPNLKFSQNGGQSWVNASRTNDNANVSLVTCAASSSIVISGGPGTGAGNGGKDIYRSTDGGQNWVGNVTLPGTAGAAFSIYHMIRAGSTFFACGNDGAATPAAYMATSSDGASGNWTQRTLPGGTGSRTALKMASNGTRVVAFGADNSFASSLGWYSDDAGVNWSNFTAPANFIVGCAYSAETGVWMALGRSGDNATIHISSDGINWGASLGTLTGAGCATSPVAAGGNQLTVNGSLWVAAAPVPATNFASIIYWSSNAGTNWRAARIGSVSMAIRSVLYAPQTQVGFHGGFSIGEAAVSGSDWTTNYRQSIRTGLPAYII